MILSSTQKLQVVLGAAPTNQLPLVAGWADMLDDASTLAPASVTSVTTGITAVDLVASPAAGSKRQIKYFSAYNADTAAVTLTVQIVDGANTRVLGKVTLAVGSRIEYTGDGFRVFDSTGALAGSGGGGFTNPMTTQGDLIVGGAAGAPTRLAAGATAGHVLTSNGSGVAASYQALPASGGAGITWLTISATGTSAVNTFERIAAASLTRTLPTVAVNDFLVYHAAAASLVISTPHTIKQGATTICAPGDTLTLAQGETVWLLANSTSEMGIV